MCYIDSIVNILAQLLLVLRHVVYTAHTRFIGSSSPNVFANPSHSCAIRSRANLISHTRADTYRMCGMDNGPQQQQLYIKNAFIYHITRNLHFDY